MRAGVVTQSGGGRSDEPPSSWLAALARARAELAGSADELVPADVSLARGSAGLALTYAALDQMFRGGPLADPDDAGRAERCAELALEGEPATAGGLDGNHAGALFTGVLGTAWALVTAAFDADVDDVDRFAVRLANLRPWPGSVDLTNGIVGVGVYGLARLADGPGTAIVAAVTQRLAESRVGDSGQAWWPTPAAAVPAPRQAAFPDGYVDVGVAHGHAGVVAFLAAAASCDIAGARPLLVEAAAWLAAQRVETGPGRLPLLLVDGQPASGGRLAWCYGDAGGAAALLAAAEALGDDRLWALALDVARAAATRPDADAGVTDAGLCHGAAGIAHILRRVAARTGDATVAAGADRWLDEAVALATQPATSGPGLLEGTAGTALALASAIAGDDDPAWDGFLLLRPPASWAAA